jgi:hypothetical protein
MSINAKISINTLDDFENNYNNMKDQVLSMIHEDFLKNYISFEDLKKSFIPKKKKMIIIKKKRFIKKEGEKCLAAVWQKGEKKRCGNKQQKDCKFCQFHDLESKRHYGIF